MTTTNALLLIISAGVVLNLVLSVCSRGASKVVVQLSEDTIRLCVEEALNQYRTLEQAQEVAGRIVSLRVVAHHNLQYHFKEMTGGERREAGDMLEEADDLERTLDEAVSEGYLDQETKEALVQMPPIPGHAED